MTVVELAPEALRAAASRLLTAHTQVDATADDVVRLLGACRIEQVVEGHIVCREGDVGDVLYILLEGKVRVSKSDLTGQVRTVGEVCAPTLLGQMAMIDRARRTATCSASSPVLIATMDRSSYRALVRSTDPGGTALCRLLLSSLTQQLIGGNARLGKLLEESASKAESPSGRVGLGGALLKASGLLEGWMANATDP